jgi:phosphoribosylamine--glycine ligase
MNVLILGSGGREHAFAWKIAQSPLLTNLFVAPGNAGTAQIATNVPLNPEKPEAVAQFALENQISLILVGPEAPLVAGVSDYFAEHQSLKHIKIIGPKKQGAMLEGSKDFSKLFMLRHKIPTAQARTFTKHTLEEGLYYLENQEPPFVLKADGLAAGKGVIITSTLSEAKDTLKEMLEGKFGAASKKVLVEQFLEGIELSVFVLTDGKNYVLLPSAKDYKRIGEGDTGLNTGGMGAVSPVPFANEAFMKKVEDKIIKPTIEGLQKESIDYLGFIFFGLINVKGEPYVIEYNARMGDPETEVVMPRLKSDFLSLLIAAGDRKLDTVKVEFDSRTATTVMLVSGGYPEDYEKGKKMTGFADLKDVLAFHAGTCLDSSGNVLTNGGRVIALTAYGENIPDALKKSNEGAAKIQYDKKYYRKDIGLDLMK